MRLLITGGSGFIGTNLIDRAIADGHTICDLSMSPPLNPELIPNWIQSDIMNSNLLCEQVAGFAPDAIIHLAARAECDENTTVEAGYAVNTVGTANVLQAVRQCSSVQRLVITSTQYVCGPGRLPTHDEDYFPHTVYGASKVETERLTRQADLSCTWTIVRPTNIWGPWHQRYQREFWRIAARGLYVHPGRSPIVRCYGYVGNVVDQMLTILKSPAPVVDRKTFYVGDPPSDIYNWANAFCLALSGRSAPRIPRALLRTIAYGGDAISTITGRPFYLTSSRFENMITDYLTPMDSTYATLGPPRFSLEEGVEATVAWLREHSISTPS